MVQTVLKLRIPVRWMSTCGRYHVSISEKCLREMLALCRKHLPREIGTSVYGTYSADGFHARVLGNSPIATDSVGGRCSLYRGSQGASHFFADLFMRTQGKQHYVGEWHSHPSGPPHPSGTDNRTLRAIAWDTATNCPECILLILGGDLVRDPTLGVYVYSRQRGRIELSAERERAT